MIVSIGIILFLIWAAIAEVDEVEVAKGEVVPSQYIQSIQHLEGGTIRKINVKEGDLLEKGATIIVLDDTSLRRDLAKLQLRYTSFSRQAKRLQAFLKNENLNFEKMVVSSSFEREQIKILQGMIHAFDAKEEVLHAQILQRKSEIRMLEKKIYTLKKNAEIVRKEREIKKKLTEQGVLSKIKFFDIEREYNDIVGEVGETESLINQSKSRLDESHSRLESLRADKRDEAFRNLELLQSDLAENKEEQHKMEALLEQTKIKSPTYGLVKALYIKTVGGVVEAGKVLADIVPLQGVLLVECKIMAEDIGHIRIGQDVDVSVSAYDAARYGTVDGKLAYISATTFVGKDQSRYYLARVMLSKKYVGQDPKANLIVPGMTVEANIITGKKSILEYLLKPINKAMDTAFREK
ncbi:HlyD family type I secretion periplasmic adaptor subunit [Alphaproteobacteria bacterium]|nr:HlyD family type I secretion periplasmic adaptor subunit [Alphaproteobacteria bacterium]